ncbi:glycerol-3-phosphate dehydrogenase [Cochlodiniinecator piscidefendens]|uniref:glycerol-3-phosphate dehydrogenase n=1 Tax=Cochlodiniinecator piscidefendens TaxID=2715756 RepID=UPI00140747B3|nr:glycerol-3-phosphate dehydrogenase [Cochlodiniinecator piscidefendens]
MTDSISDIFIIGGGINGCGIARDAAGRGLDVTLAEMGDLAQATSSASTKLFHGGLRYLEFFDFRLVAEALKERETLLSAMPHISHPMRFVLPYHAEMRFEKGTPTSKLLTTFMPWMKGRRPAWLIRLGLFLYDRLGKRDILPGTSTVDLTSDVAGGVLKDKFQKAFEYSDCWVDDARLVVLNARDAQQRGAKIMTRTKVLGATREGGIWHIKTKDQQTGVETLHKARAIVNAAGPWVEDVLKGTLARQTEESIRLVRGSHIVVRKRFDHDRAYFFQGEDGRIIFAIPYEDDFTLIGTTDADHPDADTPAKASEAEQDYLCRFASQYFESPVRREDVVWTYSGTRPLYDDGASSATAATREYVLSLDDNTGAPLLSVFGGKITTYRKLAEAALEKIAPLLGNTNPEWTAGVALPGGDFPVDGRGGLEVALRRKFDFLSDRWARRLVRLYGTEADKMLDGAETSKDLGRCFGATLTEKELAWLVSNEYAKSAEDVVWRRTKLGLRLSNDEIAAIQIWFDAQGGK